ncbi:vacuolar protein sorting vps41 [Holotrichia oblita]|uniref:Vacuolar protein sorting vps41 n=1 Tax=Holotrichia oblita TaxID=644536 RepID=A0ACB9TX21_HOLOL|nr:vacuolar protein sorting vps41 [Holotrichia oblita]
MGSETDEILIEDSDESLLDIKELNDIEYDIPPAIPPSLETILWDMESEEGSDNTSLHSLQSLMVKFRSLLYHCILQGISAQVSSASERVGAGLPTVVTNSLKYVAIGTSHGYILAFDSEQKLCWCCHDMMTNDQGAISALAFNLDSTRLLVGYERGYISMVDALSGDVIRRLPDAHAPQSAVLQLRFTSLNSLALCGDSSGCVFLLTFGRRLGVRVSDSKCLFSGARGEVCCFEPLVHGQELLGNHLVVAMATLSKVLVKHVTNITLQASILQVIVITIKPKLRVLFSQQLARSPTSLPLLSWQLVPVGKTWQPVLAWGRGVELNYTRIVFTGLNSNRIRVSGLRQVRLPYTLAALHWLGPRHLAILDISENLRLIEVRTQRELEILELTSAGLVYSSAHFKALAIGGGVSEAFALAGERACYNSLSSRGEQLLVLGTKAVHMVKLRTWHERLMYLSDQGRWSEALNLAAEEGIHREKSTTVLLERYLENLDKQQTDKDSLTAAINCCVKLKKTDLLCNELWDAISKDHHHQDWFFLLLSDHIHSGNLYFLSPSVTQALVAYLEPRDTETLESVLLSLDLSCLDLHQVLRICKEKKLYNAWIHITTKAIGDYTGPLIEFLSELSPENHRLGNTMLVYVLSCLTGLGYPKGKIPEDDVARVKSDVLRCLETIHSINSDENEPKYPYLRALLKYNTRELLNVVEIAFNEEEFTGEMGLLQRERLVHILMQIVVIPDFDATQVINLACFICRLITSNNLTLEGDTLNEVMKSLTHTLAENMSFRDHSEREQAWLDFLNAGKLSCFTLEEMLQMALDSKCYRIAEFIYEQQKEYSNILECYLKDDVRKTEVFGYILTYINVSERCVQEQFIINFRDLVKVNSKKTADLVIEHFPNLLEELFVSIENQDDLQYPFLAEIVYSDIKIPPRIAETYLELLCIRDPSYVVGYVRLGLCRVEEALKITEKHGIPAATAILLEQMGEWSQALQLLLDSRMGNEAVELCIRGAEHLDSKSAQNLWLDLVKHSNGDGAMSPRQLLHAAAPHVPPAQLLELVSDASFGDVKVLLEGIMADYTHDISMLTTTLKLLGKDLHQGLAKALFNSGKAISVPSPICNLCQQPLLRVYSSDDEKQVSLWGCGHCFHSGCFDVAKDTNACPLCRTSASRMGPPKNKKKVHLNNFTPARVRPDLEGHF